MSDCVIPFLKWPGGKRWLVAYHKDLLPCRFNRYFEPFLGAGSMFFHLKPNSAVLSDINPDLIDAYKAIKGQWRIVDRVLLDHQRKHNEDYYYQIRASRGRSLADRAARFIYLNRTCFNGIYRVNSLGVFNVPIGTRSVVVRPSDDFGSTARLLSKADVRVADFESTIGSARQGDFVFADPPYTVRHNVNGFVLYNEDLFSWDDQIRLADCLFEASARGVKILATNANHQTVRRLYRERGFFLSSVSRFSPISASADCRKQFEELVVRNYKSE